MNEKTEAEAVETIAKRSMRAQKIRIERGDRHAADVLLVPKGNGVFEPVGVKRFVDEYLDRPERMKGTAMLTDLGSFIAHVNEFKDEDSALFAVQGDEPRIVCVYDYNRSKRDDGEAEPRFGEHRARYDFPLSEEWEAWTGSDGQAMNQQAFAEFIENRIADVVDPSRAGDNAKAFAATLGATFATPSKLLGLSRGLSVRVGQTIRQATNLSSGEAEIQFESQHTDERGKALMVPQAFLIGVPMFRNGARYQIPARLRYRLTGGSISWFFELYRADAALEHAVNEACIEAKSKTALRLFFGAAEV